MTEQEKLMYEILGQITTSDIPIVYLKDDIIVATHTILIRSAVKTIASLIKLGSECSSECNIIKNTKKKIKARIQLIITNISYTPHLNKYSL